MRRSGNSRSSWTGFKKSPGCRGRRTTRVDRSWTFGIERCATVPVERTVKDGPVLRAARRERAESQADAAFGRAVHKDALLRRCENDRRASQARLYRQSETSPAITAADGIGSDLSETAAVGACAWSSHLSVPAAPRCYYATQSSVVERHHVHPAAHRFHLSSCGHGLVQPVRAQLGNIDEPGCRILLLGSGLCVAAGPSGNLQHRPGIAIHQRRVHRQTRGREYPDQHGWPRPRIGQRFCRAAVENSQIRRRLSEGLQRSSRCGSESSPVLQLLQWAAAASSVELSDARSRVLRSERSKTGYAQGRLRCRSSFIAHPGAKLFRPHNKNKDAASRRLLLMSFEGMSKTSRTIEAPTQKADAPGHLSDEFPAGYSSTGCPPALPASASPAGVDYASGLAQLRGIFNNERSRTENRNQTHRQRSTLTGQFFCPKNGEYLILCGLDCLVCVFYSLMRSAGQHLRAGVVWPLAYQMELCRQIRDLHATI